jgi:hypothetical protein
MSTDNLSHSYSIEPTTDGFVVSGKGHLTTIVSAIPTGFVVSCPERLFDSEKTFGLLDYYRLSAHIADCLMDKWESPRGGFTHRWLRDWAYKQCACAIGKRVHAQWKRLLAEADPQILAVQKALFSVSLSCPAIAHDLELYEHSVIRDVLQYRAAAIAVSEVATMRFVIQDRRAKNALLNVKLSPEWQAIVNSHPGLQFELDAKLITPNEQITPFDLLEDWRGMFSPDGKSYRSLDRTLMNLPGRVPASLASNLLYVRLPRPLTDRLELTTVLFASTYNHPTTGSPANLPIFLYARHDRIVRAMERISGYTHISFSPNRAGDVRQFVKFMFDGDDNMPYTGTIVGLAERAIDYHENRLQEKRDEMIQQYGSDLEVAKPAVPLPDTEGIHFLATVGDIAEEGEIMNNCIASYVPQALHGECFLFHIEKDSEIASIEVSPTGKIEQAYGPGNTDNKAAKWGARELQRWASAYHLASNQPIPVEIPAVVDNRPAWEGDDEFPF